MAKKKKFHVEFDIVGTVIEDRFLGDKVVLDKRTIEDRLESTFKPKGDIGREKLGDCELKNVEVKPKSK